MSLEHQMQLTRLLHSSTRLLDDQNYDGFLQLFTSEGEYSITCLTPELAEKMIWMKATRSEIDERLKAMNEHEWQIAHVEQTRILSVDTIDIGKNTSNTSSSFSLYQTDQQGRSELYVLGRYEDEWQYVSKRWYLAKREVALRTRLLKMLSPLPI
jgi:3-phenylpropionate/cinnamic acid dioxygenase small subunit